MPLFRPHAVVAALLSGDVTAADRVLAGHAAAFADWAVQHRLGPIVHTLAGDASPVRAVLRDHHVYAAAEELKRRSWVPQLLAALNARGVQPFVFKGLGVAHHARVYAAPDLRPLGDVDLLVPPDELGGAIEAARTIGFVLEHEDPAIGAFARQEHYQVSLVHPQHGLLELHHALYRDIPVRATEVMLERAVPTRIYDQPVLRLADPDVFFVLAVHLAKSSDQFLWLWLMDLALLARALSDADWEQLLESTLAWGGQVFVLACLRMLEEVWLQRPAELPADYPSRLESRLSFVERRASRAFMASLPAGPLGGDGLVLARRLSGRPGRRSSPLRALVCHPGVVCLELAVRSDEPGFVWQRVRHAALRARRGVRIASRVARAAARKR